MLIPHRTASSAKSGWLSAPAELQTWRMPGLTPRRETVSMKSSNCRRVIASSDSAFAKCVHVPASRVPRDSSMYRASAGASSGALPKRPMPVSIFRCTGTGRSDAPSASASSRLDTVMLQPVSEAALAEHVHDDRDLHQQVAREKARVAESLRDVATGGGVDVDAGHGGGIRL